MIFRFQKPDDLSEGDKLSIARIFLKTFQNKFYAALRKVREEDRAEVMAQLLQFRQGWYYKEDDEILGAVFISSKNICNFGVSKTLKSRIGRFRSFIMDFMAIPPADNHVMKVDGIGVLEKSRGRGIGTLLFEEVFRFARDNGIKKMKLAVINTNHKAKKLYNKLGFRFTRSTWTAPITGKLGFTSYHTMIKQM